MSGINYGSMEADDSQAIKKRARIKTSVDQNARILLGDEQSSLSRIEHPEQRRAFIRVLALSSNQRMRDIAEDAVSNPYSIARIIHDHHISVHAVADEFRAIKKSLSYLPGGETNEIIDQDARDAIHHYETCEKCGGQGHYKRPGAKQMKCCSQCDGKGKIYVRADRDAIRSTLEVYGLLNQKGPLINQNINLTSTEKAESLDALSESIAPLLEGQGDMK
jgi:hypothetical protein